MQKSMIEELFEPTQKVKLKHVHVGSTPIRKPKEDSPYFQSVRRAIAQDGITVPIHLNLVKDEEDNLVPNEYTLIDGGNRNRIAILENFDYIPAHIAKRWLTDDECRSIQLSLNHHRIPQTAKEEANSIALYLADKDPIPTLQETADFFRMSLEEAEKVLALKTLIPEALNKLRDGAMNMSQAMELARCKETKYPGLQLKILQTNLMDAVPEFVLACRNGRKEINKGRPVSKDLVPSVRKHSDIITDWETLNNRCEQLEDDPGPQEYTEFDLSKAIYEKVNWILQKDPESEIRRTKKKKEKVEKLSMKQELAEQQKQLEAYKEQYGQLQPTS